MPLLRDRVVLVSGGTSGLGAAIARAAAREGALVAVTGRRREPGEALAAELTAAGAKALFIQADIGEVEQARASVTAAVAGFGRVDSLVNAAGLTSRGTLLDTTPELFDAHIAVNLKAPFFLMQAVVADLVARKAPGTIVNVLSMSAHGGQPYLAPYVAAKAGLAGLTRNAAHAHRRDRIRINGLNIGWTDTEGEDETQRRFHGAGDDWREKAGASLPMGKLGQPDEIADFVVFLLSDRSGVVTGSVIDWDQNVLGGFDLSPDRGRPWRMVRVPASQLLREAPMSLAALIASTRKVLAGDATKGHAVFAAEGTLVGVTEVDIRTGAHSFKVDEPASVGGANVAANPVQYALASLGACQAITYRIWAAQLGIDLDTVTVRVEGDLDLRGCSASTTRCGLVFPRFASR